MLLEDLIRIKAERYSKCENLMSIDHPFLIGGRGYRSHIEPPRCTMNTSGEEAFRSLNRILIQLYGLSDFLYEIEKLEVYTYWDVYVSEPALVGVLLYGSDISFRLRRMLSCVETNTLLNKDDKKELIDYLSVNYERVNALSVVAYKLKERFKNILNLPPYTYHPPNK